MRPKKALFEYQRIGAVTLSKNRAFGLFDDPGLGKTPQVISAIRAGKPVVIVCPSAVKLNWASEFRDWRGKTFRIRVARGTAGFRWPKPGTVLITNYESLPPSHREVLGLHSSIARLRSSTKTMAKAQKLAARARRYEALRSRLTEPFEGTYLVADEAQRLKNKEARCTGRFREMATRVVSRSGSIWVVTGTPLVNRAEELWVVLQAAGLGTRAFGSHEQFVKDCAEPGVVAGKLRLVSLRRSRDQVLPFLPQIRREVRVVPIGSSLRAQLDAVVAGLKRRGVNLATATLEQIRTAASSVEMRDHVSRTREALATAKTTAALEWVSECEESGIDPVVFCSHRRPLDLLAQKKGWGQITGDQSDTQKQEVASQFQSGVLRGVAVSYRAGGAGINLFRAWRGLCIDLPWTPADVDQAESRLRRIGQKARGLLFTRLVADHPLERRVERLLARKQGEIDRCVGLSSVEAPPVDTRKIG